MSQAASLSVPWLQLPATLLRCIQSFPLSAVIDRGAGESFIDRNVAKQNEIETVGLESPKEAKFLNCLPIDLLELRTAPVKVLLSRNHKEEICLQIIDCLHTPLALGYS